VHPTKSYFGVVRIARNRPVPTLISGGASNVLHHSEPRLMNTGEWLACSTFPMDMRWPSKAKPSRKKWFMGMSVPPFMVQRIALEIRKQWTDELLHSSQRATVPAEEEG